MGEFNIITFEANNKKEPFTEWILSLEKTIQKRMFLRLAKIRAGNLGDYKFIGEGVFELRFFFDSGYRVYFGIDEKSKTVILIYGGNKDTQKKDIKKAQAYWKKHNERKNQEG